MDPYAQDLVARLRRNPDDSQSYSALRAHYHRLGDYASLANLLEGWAARSKDVGAAAASFFEAAELCEGYLDDRPRAVSLLERSLERNPLHLESSARLEEIFEASGDQRRLLDLLEKRAQTLVEANADPRHAAGVHQQIGEIWEQRLGRVDRAINHYRKAFELDPTAVAAIYAAREIYRNAGNLKAASALYDLEVEAEADPKRKVALLREVAHMRAEQLSDLEGAVIALTRAQTQAPTDLSVMHDLATVLLKRAESRADEASASVDRQKAADLLFQMAQSVPPDHGLAYAEASLDAAPDHDGALGLLEKIAGDLKREDILPIRWVAYLQVAPASPGTDRMRRRLGAAYVDAKQLEDAIICFEPLLERGDAEAAESLVDLYRQAGRARDVVRALSVAVTGLPADKRVPRLREIIAILVEQGDLGEARDRAREILSIDASDPEAIAFLEDDCRTREAWGELRDLLLAAGRVPGLSAESRKQRLREVAKLSEDKLSDIEGAISAWRAITALDPADGSARTRLAELLEQTERWDELVQVLEREALSLTDPDAKAELHRRLARIHRHHRQSLMEAIEAYRALQEIRPGDDGARDELCDTLIDAGAFLEAVPMMRQRIDAASDRAERADLLGRLAGLLHERVGDDEGAFEAATRLLDEDPGNVTALDRMERIDHEARNWDRLLETLSYRTELTADGERAEILVRMARIADEALSDLDRAAEYYAKAVDLAPETPGALDALCAVYDRAGRYKDLVVLLKARAQDEDDPSTRADLFRRIARTMAQRVGNDDAAAEAFQEVLVSGEDEEALRYLQVHADKHSEHSDRAGFLGRLAVLVDSEQERRDLMLEQARVLASEVSDDEAALKVLEDVVSRVDPNHLGALGHLAALAEKLANHHTLSMALERQLEITEDGGLRVPLASRLADLYENVLGDGPRAIDALRHWTDADLTDPEPLQRLVRLLEAAGRNEELLEALDALAGVEQDPQVVSELTRRAAALAVSHMGDVDGSWKRLAEQSADGDDECELALRELAKEVSRGEQLAQFYVTLAQDAAVDAEQRRRWSDAAEVLEEFVGDAGRALEAILRAFATDLDDDGLLDDVDRLAVAASAWPRLAQVYDTLLKRAPDDEAKVSLLMRHAHLLDVKAADQSGALDRVLRACNVAPDDEDVLEAAEELAPRAGRAEELFVVYDRRRAKASDDEGRVRALLRAAKLADLALKDRKRALTLVRQAVLSSKTPELLGVIEDAMRALDTDNPEPGPGAALRALVAIYQNLAEKVAEDAPGAGAVMLRRAAQLFRDDLDDTKNALKFLVRASSYAPGDEDLLEELEQLSEREGRLEAFQRHLDKLVQEALDQGTAATLLERRGRVLEVELERYGEAADVYNRLLALRRGDRIAAGRLRHCLRKAGRHQDLLMALEKEADRLDDTIGKLELFKDIARVWEVELGNKYEALDAWKRVLAEDPNDDEATEAAQRLGHSTRRLTADELADAVPTSGDDASGAMPQPAPGGFEGDEPSGDFTSPHLATPPEDGPGASYDDETELETNDDFLSQLGVEDRAALESVLGFEGSAEAPSAREKVETREVRADVVAPPSNPPLLPGAPGSFADFGFEESTVTGDDDDEDLRAPVIASPEVTSELDIAEIEEIEDDADDASRDHHVDDALEDEIDDALEDAFDHHLDDAAGEGFDEFESAEVELETGDIDISSIESGEVQLSEDSIEELDDSLLEEFDAIDHDIEELDPDELPRSTPALSAPPPPPPPPPRTSTVPPPLPPVRRDDD